MGGGQWFAELFLMSENENLAGHNPNEPESGNLSDKREISFNLQIPKKAGTDPAHLALKIGLGIGVCPRFRTFFPTAFAGDRPRFLPSVGVHFVRGRSEHDQAIHWDF